MNATLARRRISAALLAVWIIWAFPAFTQAQTGDGESPREGRTSWERLGLEATAALEMNDLERARRAVASLAELAPERPLVHYLSARLAEQERDWAAALRHYGIILTAPGHEESDRWRRLAAGNWVRMRRRYNEGRVRTALGRDPGALPQPGRCLILPLEPIFLASADSREAERLEAMGVAAASWLIGSLARVEEAEPIDLPVASLLRRALTARGHGQVPAGEAATADLGPLPPITTVLGVTSRLARLRPGGPPPGAETERIPPAYLLSEPAGRWTGEAAAALAHFQVEHDLPATGIVDPETRAALERAYRRQSRQITLPEPDFEFSDPGRAMAQLLGAEVMLTGTLELEEQQAIRWQVAWISPRDGALIGVPIEGVLPREHFAPAWVRMQRLILEGSPFCRGPEACAQIALPDAPQRDGAISFGQALLLLEEGREADSAALFAQAARQGAGEQAAWYAMAWGQTEAERELLARELLDEGIRGPVVLPPGLLSQTGSSLAAGLSRRPATPVPAAGWGTVLTFVPETGWLRIEGSLEGR